MPPTYTERSLSPSDAELSSPEVAVCYAIEDDSEEEIPENGQEVDDLNTLVRVQSLCFHSDVSCLIIITIIIIVIMTMMIMVVIGRNYPT